MAATAPDSEWWGRTIEEQVTRYFHIVYHPRDRAAVLETAAEIDGFYERLAADLGIESLSDDPLYIEVQPRTDLMTYRFNENKLAVPSPGLLPAPADATPGVALKQSIARAIVYRLMEMGGIERDLDSRGRAFADGIRHWEGWDLAGGIQPWNEAGQLVELRKARDEGQLVPVEDINAAWFARESRVASHAEAMLLANYVAKTFGREHFADILKAWPEHKSWREIAPQVLGVRFEEFEAGWLAHLEQVIGPGTVTAH